MTDHTRSLNLEVQLNVVSSDWLPSSCLCRLSPNQNPRENISQPIESCCVRPCEGQPRTPLTVLFQKIAEALLRCCRKGDRCRIRFCGIRGRGQQFTEELKRGAKKMTATDGEFFAPVVAF